MVETMNTQKTACKALVLDAGPLLSLSPLRGLAETFYTVPQVLDELKDKRAREHFEKLGLSAGVKIQVQSPDSASLAEVIQFAKKTGDYSVLSHADLCVIALTHSLDKKEKEREAKETSEPVLSPSDPATDATTPETSDQAATDEPASAELPHDDQESLAETAPESEASEPPASLSPSEDEGEEDTIHAQPEEGVENHSEDTQEREKLDVELRPIQDEETGGENTPIGESPPNLALSEDAEDSLEADNNSNAPVYDDPSDEDDGEGEWITPSNVGLHKSRALHLVPDEDAKSGKSKKPVKQIGVGCMTADFAMQNVLLQMGLSLVGVEGKRIEKVKTWVLRCHACFKICKDNSRKFCPSCGNPTLLRASVTISSPTANSSTPAMQVHLKKNFQYRTRGTIYSIPSPKPGSAKTGTGDGLILREDQTAWMRAKTHADGKREREEKRMLNGTANARGDAAGVVVGSWMDPDWVPEMLSVGAGGKGRSMRSRGFDGDMPVIGYGKKNPNERKRKPGK